jgi:23S rRNA pseudoU1915 N3-methylase RlmH
MNLSVQEIAAEISALPKQEQQEVVDFVEFLKIKLARRQAKCFLENQESQSATQTEGERVLKILEKAGLLNCMKGGDEKLSENYTAHLWSNE